MKEKKNVLMVLAVIVMSIGIVFFIVGTESKIGQQLRDGGDEGTSIVYPNDSELVRELEITVSVSEAQLNYLQRLSEPLKSKYAKLSIEFVYDEAYEQSTDEFIQHLKKTISMGKASDVLLVDNRVAAKLAAEGYVLALDGLVQAGGYHPALIETLRWNRSIWGLPWEADPYVLVWHPDGLEIAGFGGLPDTIYDLQIMEEQFSQQRSLFYIDPGDPLAAFSLLNVWKEGISFANTVEVTATGTEINISDAESIWSKLRNGKVAMYIIKASALSEKHEQEGFQVEPLNRLNFDDHAQQEVGWIAGTSFVVVATTKLKQEALEWIEQAASLEGDSFEQHPFEVKIRQALTSGEKSSFVAPTGVDISYFDNLLDQFWTEKITAEQLLSSYQDWLEQAQP